MCSLRDRVGVNCSWKRSMGCVRNACAICLCWLFCGKVVTIRLSGVCLDGKSIGVVSDVGLSSVLLLVFLSFGTGDWSGSRGVGMIRWRVF